MIASSLMTGENFQDAGQGEGNQNRPTGLQDRIQKLGGLGAKIHREEYWRKENCTGKESSRDLHRIPLESSA